MTLFHHYYDGEERNSDDILYNASCHFRQRGAASRCLIIVFSRDKFHHDEGPLVTRGKRPTLRRENRVLSFANLRDHITAFADYMSDESLSPSVQISVSKSLFEPSPPPPPPPILISVIGRISYTPVCAAISYIENRSCHCLICAAAQSPPPRRSASSVVAVVDDGLKPGPDRAGSRRVIRRQRAANWCRLTSDRPALAMQWWSKSWRTLRNNWLRPSSASFFRSLALSLRRLAYGGRRRCRRRRTRSAERPSVG